MRRSQGSMEYLLILAAILAIAVIVVIILSQLLAPGEDSTTVTEDKYNLAIAGFDIKGYDRPFNPADPTTAPGMIVGSDNEQWDNCGGLVGSLDDLPCTNPEKIGTLNGHDGNEYSIYTCKGCFYICAGDVCKSYELDEADVVIGAWIQGEGEQQQVPIPGGMYAYAVEAVRDTITFSPGTSGEGAETYDYLWEFGDTTTSTERFAAKVYDDVTVDTPYTITLTVTDTAHARSVTKTTYAFVSPVVNNPPTNIQVISPTLNEIVGGLYTVEFSADDPDGDQMNYEVALVRRVGNSGSYVSPVPYYSGTDSNFVLDTTTLTDGIYSIYAIIVSDGYESTSHTFDLRFTIDNTSPPPSSDAPEITLTYPNGGESLSGTETITWTASDPNGDPLTYSVYYKKGSDITLYPIAVGISVQSASWDTTATENGADYLVYAVASDGTYVDFDKSDAVFTVSN